MALHSFRVIQEALEYQLALEVPKNKRTNRCLQHYV